MKKLLASCMLLSASSAFADVTPLFEFSAGVGSWSTEYSGEVGDANNTANMDELGLDDATNTFIYASFEHAVPLIPQVRVEHTSLSTDGSGTLEGTYTIGGTTYSGGTDLNSSMDLTFTDFILYYEVAILDFGLDFRQFDVEISATEDGSGTTTTESADAIIPLVFLQAQVDLPLTGVYVLGNVSTISYDDKSITDYRAAVGYEIELSVLSEIGVEAGYRAFEIELGDEENISGNVDMSGIYFGLNITF